MPGLCRRPSARVSGRNRVAPVARLGLRECQYIRSPRKRAKENHFYAWRGFRNSLLRANVKYSTHTKTSSQKSKHPSPYKSQSPAAETHTSPLPGSTPDSPDESCTPPAQLRNAPVPTPAPPSPPQSHTPIPVFHQQAPTQPPPRSPAQEQSPACTRPIPPPPQTLP